jgi:hypothetical protein
MGFDSRLLGVEGLLEVERGRLAASWSMGPLFVDIRGDVDDEERDERRDVVVDERTL